VLNLDQEANALFSVMLLIYAAKEPSAKRIACRSGDDLEDDLVGNEDEG
jgi:hypothetical protein